MNINMRFIFDKLQGNPKAIKIRLYRVPTEEELRRFPHRKPYISNVLNGEKSKDIAFTEWGEVEKAVVYDYYSEWENIPHEIGESYEAQFDEHHNLVHSLHKETSKRVVDYKAKVKEYIVNIRTEEHQVKYEYDGQGNLLSKTDYNVFFSQEKGRKDTKHLYSIISYFGENGMLKKQVWDGNRIVLYGYECNRLVTEEILYERQVYNLFEQGVRYEKGYSTHYEYDSVGNLTSKIVLTPEGSAYVIEEMQYDNNGELICKLRRTEEKVTRTKYYDRKRVTITIDNSNQDFYRVKAFYKIENLDNHGNVVESYCRIKAETYNERTKLWKKDEPSEKVKTFKYTYDSHGNWTQKEYYEGGKHLYFITREIEYWDE